ncbi:hypothetical protein [Desulfotalea psychrophila]|uniref:Lipoprotein n=1 Tax=Desulfotalea psychrophila (strain LSv54 / DSM 12343) TaxID=177439 RepID=Q6AM53_DESPS|nr:hypothetical protein [Desulfotalea psychrophila]CAG36572.1 unknown protein [Desulfotalea psychrophila LSv54]
MTKKIILFLVLLGLSGCASSIPPMDLEEGAESPLLYSIRIYRGDEVRFSGILVLQSTGTPLSYALLDSTGVTLLSAEIDEQGQQNMESRQGPLKDSHLPTLLATSLYRIFFAHAAASDCQADIFSFYRETEMGRRRACYLGPLSLWSVQQSDDSLFAGAIYSQTGLQIKLVRIANDSQ